MYLKVNVFIYVCKGHEEISKNIVPHSLVLFLH